VTRPNDEVLLAFLEETLGEQGRARVLEQLEADPELAAELERAAAGLEALRSMPSATPAAPRSGRIARWWVAIASVATLAIAIPTPAHDLWVFSAAFALGTTEDDVTRRGGLIIITAGSWPSWPRAWNGIRILYVRIRIRKVQP